MTKEGETTERLRWFVANTVAMQAERCHCRKAQIQRNHIACCLLVWHRLKALAIELESNIYQLKQGLLDAYMRKQLKKPDLVMAFS